MVELVTLGRVEVRGADGKGLRAVPTRPKDLALLTYLTVAGAFAFERRDTLLALFWPDLDTSHARNALSQALHRLRQWLPKGGVVIEGHESVRVSSEELSCDAVSFDSHLQAGELSNALGLYGGDFLRGFHVPRVAPEFDDWVASERERLRGRAFNALLLLIEVEEKSGTGEAAIAWLRRAAELRPLDETICRRLIEALIVTGDKVGALAEYERFARRLRNEYGLFPSAATRSLPDAIRRSLPSGGTYDKAPRRVPDGRVAEAYLKGRYFTSTIDQTARGLQCLRRAVELDPTFAPAHAATALSLANLAILGHLAPDEARALAAGAARLALASDDTLGDAHTAIGAAAMIFDWDWHRAEREFRIGIALSPNSGDAHSYFAQFLCAVGRADEGMVQAEVAQHLDPLGVWANFTLGWVLFRARRHHESIDRLRSLLELYPHLAYAHLFLAENYVSMAAYPEAIDACRTALEILPEDQLVLGLTACVIGLSGELDLARALECKLEALARSAYVCPGHLAAALLGVGQRDRAFECWSAMCDNRSALACLVPTDPLYDSVRGDARFAALCDRLRIPLPLPTPHGH